MQISHCFGKAEHVVDAFLKCTNALHNILYSLNYYLEKFYTVNTIRNRVETDMADNLSWETVSESVIFKTRIMDVCEKSCLSPEKETRQFITLKSRSWVMIIPEIEIDGRVHFLMVKQWRHGSESLSVEFPGGIIDPCETPEEAARRELIEETGYEPQQLQYLTAFSPNPAIMENRQYVFTAKCNPRAAHGLDLDEDEFLNVSIEPRDEVIKKYGTPPYDHALHAAGLFYYLKGRSLFTPKI